MFLLERSFSWWQLYWYFPYLTSIKIFCRKRWNYFAQKVPAKHLCTKKAINDTNKEYNKKCLYYINNDVLNNNCNDNMDVLNTYYSKKKDCMNKYKDNIKTSYFIVIIFFLIISLLSIY